MIFDTNVLVSAILFPYSEVGRLVAASPRHSVLIASSAARAELEEVVMRSKFDSYHPPEHRRALLLEFMADMEPVEMVHAVSDCVHPADNKFLELALSGRADIIITGDDHLLRLHPWRGIPILTPSQYLALEPGNDLP